MKLITAFTAFILAALPLLAQESATGVNTYKGICQDSSASSTAQSCNTRVAFIPKVGDTIIYTTTTANSGALTLAVNGTAAVAVQKEQGTALVSGDLKASVPVTMSFDGTNWQLPTVSSTGTLLLSNLLLGTSATSTSWFTGTGPLIGTTNGTCTGTVPANTTWICNASGTLFEMSPATTLPLVEGPTTSTNNGIPAFDSTGGCCFLDTGIIYTNIVRKDAVNTGAAAMTLDMSAATGTNALRSPAQAALTVSAAGATGEDTTATMYHNFTGGVDSLVMTVPASATITNNDCAKLSVSGSVVTVADNGSACGSGGATTWSGITNPTGNLALTMSTDTTTFNYASPLASAFTWANTTAAVTGTNHSGPILNIGCGRDFVGATPADTQDCFTVQTVLPNGNNEIPSLTFGSNTASTNTNGPNFQFNGTLTVTAPNTTSNSNLLCLEANGSSTCQVAWTQGTGGIGTFVLAPGVYLEGNPFAAPGFAMNNAQRLMSSGYVESWTNGNAIGGTVDTRIRRYGAGELGLDTGTTNTFASLTLHSTEFGLANAGTTGTTQFLLAKLTGAPSTAVNAATTDTNGIVGVTQDGAGTSGTALIAWGGKATCTFDGATTAGDYVQPSGTVAGNCHDAGSTRPASNEILGRVLSTNAAGGNFVMLVQLEEQ